MAILCGPLLNFFHCQFETSVKLVGESKHYYGLEQRFSRGPTNRHFRIPESLELLDGLLFETKEFLLKSRVVNFAQKARMKDD